MDWLLRLESSGPADPRGQHSYWMKEPTAKLVWKRGQGHFGDGAWQPLPDPWAVLRGWLRDQRRPLDPSGPPFQGGIAGYFGYGLAHLFERIPPPTFDEFDWPDLCVGLFESAQLYDPKEPPAWPVTAEPLGTPRVPAARGQFPVPGIPGVFSNFTREAYLAAVQRAIAYIHAGDCFQVNLSQRLVAPAQHPVRLFEKLRLRSPAPFSGILLAEDFAVVSASPERFIRLDAAGRLETRPIKGTRPRRQPVEADAAAAQELLDSPKDRAENVMIVDLLRNDLGRVCEFGSVRVAAVCELESYRNVHHLVSVVEGQLRPGLDAFDVLRATLPGGSVTGAPKVRAMEIISELEPTARGPYCGCLGWIGFDGAMDTSILIRTFSSRGGWLQFPVGGGIVADSDPEAEYEETLHKAAGLLRALED